MKGTVFSSSSKATVACTCSARMFSSSAMMRKKSCSVTAKPRKCYGTGCGVHALRRPRREAAIASPQRKPGTGRATGSTLPPACKTMKVEFSSVGEKYKRQHDGQRIAARNSNLPIRVCSNNLQPRPIRGFKMLLLDPTSSIPWPSRERADASPFENVQPRLCRGFDIFKKSRRTACCACPAPGCAQKRPAGPARTSLTQAGRRQKRAIVSMNSLNVLGEHKAGRPLCRVAAHTSRRCGRGEIDHAALGAHVKTAAAVA